MSAFKLVLSTGILVALIINGKPPNIIKLLALNTL